MYVSILAVVLLPAIVAAGLLPRASLDGDLQPFTGAIGGVKASPVTNSGDPKRPFAVDGTTDVNIGAALQRSCAVQHNGCAQAANANKNGALKVGDCDKQQKACNNAGKDVKAGENENAGKEGASGQDNGAIAGEKRDVKASKNQARAAANDKDDKQAKQEAKKAQQAAKKIAEQQKKAQKQAEKETKEKAKKAKQAAKKQQEAQKKAAKKAEKEQKKALKQAAKQQKEAAAATPAARF